MVPTSARSSLLSTGRLIAPGTWSSANSAGLRTSMMSSKPARATGSAEASVWIISPLPGQVGERGSLRRLKDRRYALAAADAHGLQAVSRVPPLHLAQQIGQDAPAGG